MFANPKSTDLVRRALLALNDLGPYFPHRHIHTVYFRFCIRADNNTGQLAHVRFATESCRDRH